MMRSGTRFHADKTRRQLRDQGHQLITRDARLDQHGRACHVDTGEGKNILGEIDSYGNYKHDFPSRWC
jgi:hypothetical protein